MGVAAKIGDIAKERKISLKELSRMVDIPYTTLYHAVKRDSKMEFETVQRIAVALGVPWNALYSANESDPDVKAWGPDSKTQTKDYWYRVDSASAYLMTLLNSAEYESDTEFSSDDENLWMKKKIPEIAKLYNVSEADLDDFNYWRYSEDEEYLSDIHEAIANKPIRFRSLEKICRMLMRMNADGQALAAERVEELAQIPKYQRTQSAPQDAPAGPDDKEPAEK